MADWQAFLQELPQLMKSVPAMMDTFGAGKSMGTSSFMANLGHPGAAQAVSQGLTWNDYKKLMEDAAYARQQADKLNIMKSEQALRQGEQDLAIGQENLSQEKTASSNELSKFMSEAGGMQPGQSRSRYRGREIGDDSPSMSPVGEETAEDARAAYLMLEKARLTNLENSQQQLEQRKAALNDSQYELDQVREKRLQQDSAARRETSALLADMRLNPQAKGLSRDVSVSKATQLVENNVEYMDMSAAEKADLINQIADRLQGKHEDVEEDVLGDGPISSFSGFQDDTKPEEEKTTWAVKHSVANEKKDVGQNLQRVEQEIRNLKDSEIDAMSVAERALRTEIPLHRVIGLTGDADLKAMQDDMGRFNRRAREYLSEGRDPDQWDDATYSFMQRLVEEFKKQQSGAQ